MELCKGLHVDEVRKVVDHGLHHHFQDVPGLTQAENQHHEEVAQPESRVRNRLDRHGGGGDQHDDGNHPGSHNGELVLRRAIWELVGLRCL